ncbi:HWE histidine kinase domain-containing protein [Oricola cellulosilytica]|nr:HWE histidine kinase domain-containing protein [Oricola cellulosilytica]
MKFSETQPDGHETRLNDPERLAALKATGLMDSLPEEAFDRAVRLATRITGTPVGLVSLVDGERQFFKAQIGLESPRETPLTHSFCQYVVSADRPLGVSDARDHPLLKDNLAIPDLGVVAYLGVPVHAPDGQTLGAFCAIDSSPREWTKDELQSLQDLSHVLEAELALRHAAAERQLVLDELSHRIKNLFANVSSIIRQSRRQKDSVDEFATAVELRIKALVQAHELIIPVALGAGSGPSIPFQRLLSTILEPHYHAHLGQVTWEGPAVALGSKATTALALALHELATNAAKYGALSDNQGHLGIAWEVAGDKLTLDWRETKGPAPDPTGMRAGFGSKLISLSIERQLGGSIETDYRDDGLVRRIALPLDALAA